VQFADFFTAARALRAIRARAGARAREPPRLDHALRSDDAERFNGGKAERADTADAHREGAAGAWRNAFIRMPYARERTIERGIINDTFETAITWERFESFHDKVNAATERAILEATGQTGQVTCRCTHVYPDGPAPYFTFHAAGRHGELIPSRPSAPVGQNGLIA
jgi:hypothetical protein